MKKMYLCLIVSGLMFLGGCAGGASLKSSAGHLRPDGTYVMNEVARSNDAFGPSVVSMNSVSYEVVEIKDRELYKQILARGKASTTEMMAAAVFVRQQDAPVPPPVTAAGDSVVGQTFGAARDTGVGIGAAAFGINHRPNRTRITAGSVVNKNDVKSLSDADSASESAAASSAAAQ